MNRYHFSKHLFVWISLLCIAYSILADNQCNEFDLPEIDINEFRNGNIEIRQNIAASLDRWSHEVGIIKLIHHNVSVSSLNRAYDAGKDFFHLADDEKMKYRMENIAKCGYTPTNGYQVEDATMLEMYWWQLKQLKYKNIDIDVAMDGNDSLIHFDLFSKTSDYIMNLKQLRTTYHEIVGMALGLDNMHYFENELMTNPDLYYPMFAFMYYPPYNNEDDSDEDIIRFIEHTDVMTFTFIQNDNIAGLQIFINNTWYDINTDNKNGILIFNGDAIPRMTNNWWKSTKHRVIVKDKNERLTLAYFMGPDYDKTVEILQDCVKCTKDPPNYKPISVQQYYEMKFNDAVKT